MTDTRDYLTERLAKLRSWAASTKHEIARLQRQHEKELAELAEAEAALAAVDALAEPEPDGDSIAAAIDAAEDVPEDVEEA